MNFDRFNITMYVLREGVYVDPDFINLDLQQKYVEITNTSDFGLYTVFLEVKEKMKDNISSQ